MVSVVKKQMEGFEFLIAKDILLLEPERSKILKLDLILLLGQKNLETVLCFVGRNLFVPGNFHVVLDVLSSGYFLKLEAEEYGWVFVLRFPLISKI